MASLSSSRRNSSSSSTEGDPPAWIPSAKRTIIICRCDVIGTRSSILPASGGPPMSNAKRTYTDRSDSGISDCSNHSSALLSSLNTPWLIQEEDESGCNDTSTTSSNGLTNGTHLIHSGEESNGITGGGSNKATSGVVSNNKNRIIE